MTTQASGGKKLCVRIDNGNGDKELCSWAYAEKRIGEAYLHPIGPLRQLASGHPIRCTFATYQHRDFVKGFERTANGECN